MANPIEIAIKAKGPLALFQRSRSIAQRYGFTSAQMDRALREFSEILLHFDCSATLPITAVTLKRHSNTIAKYVGQNIEFTVHGYTHVDYTKLAPETQLAHLQHARKVFFDAGMTPMGFRSPYLSRDDHLYKAIEAAGFSYVSNQPILWDVLDKGDLGSSTNVSYERSLAFYNPWRADQRPSLPRLDDHLVEIPVSLPDDEILIERLDNSNGLVEKTWRTILTQTYHRGELFTLQLHPERIGLCGEGLSAVLSQARALSPAVWCARLDAIAAWWKARTESTIEVSRTYDGGYHCVIGGPKGTTVLVRDVDIDIPNEPWVDSYRQLKAISFTVKSPLRPFIGLSPSTSIELAHFLRQQGYIVEISQDCKHYAYYIDQINFDGTQESAVLDDIEGSGCPLVRLGRWPNGAQSALAITGDIDAVTLWDYGLRLIGK
jgi:peptidoglycan/xylan/chitin deacetylase (PgdA/CDA1 family)